MTLLDAASAVADDSHATSRKTLPSVDAHARRTFRGCRGGLVVGTRPSILTGTLSQSVCRITAAGTLPERREESSGASLVQKGARPPSSSSLGKRPHICVISDFADYVIQYVITKFTRSIPTHFYRL